MVAHQTSWITRYLTKASPALFIAYGGLMAFGAYFAMYAFRKPFTSASFETAGDVFGLSIDYKSLLIIAQVFGYALSKLMGIRVVSELPAKHRALAILGLIGVAELALVGFAYVPKPYNICFLFLNGLPLGMIWGLVFGFLEGRKTSEVLGAILCASFIVASGVVKSVGKWLMLENYATDYSMPYLTGLIFAPLLIFCVWGLMQLPPPSQEDIEARVERVPMDKKMRAELFSSYAPGLIALIALYVLLTALRDFRDNFAAEIWTGVGLGSQSSLFSLTEIPIAIAVLVTMALLGLFKKNRTAIVANLVLIGFGLVVTALASLAFYFKGIGPILWMILLGAGLYLSYTPFNGLLFDRLLAATGKVGTAGFLIYVADTSGYMGSVGLLLFKNLSGIALPWVEFLLGASLISGVLGILLLAYATRYFYKRFS